MKIPRLIVLSLAALMAVFSTQAETKNETDKKMNVTKTTGETMDQQAIEQLLSKYEKALNDSSTKDVLPLYSNDGVFMPTEAPTAQGPEQLKASYDYVFNTIKLDIKFSIEEIVVSGNYAFAKTMSRGHVTVLGPKITAPEENRELFVFRKDNGEWKIARYMFNKSKPSK